MTRALELAFAMAFGATMDLCPTCLGQPRSIAVDLGHQAGECSECGFPVGEDGRSVGAAIAPGDPVLCLEDER